jgi:6-phosphogluconate dehydrogenase (decarboxylating)
MSEAYGWVGLGAMGAAMAKNLQAHLQKSCAPALSVYNRDSSKCSDLVSVGATQCDPSDLLSLVTAGYPSDLQSTEICVWSADAVLIKSSYDLPYRSSS